MATRAQIWAATVFVDYVMGYIHVGLMTDQSGNQTLYYKYNFEHKCAVYDIDIKQYHADNERVAKELFFNSIKPCM